MSDERPALEGPATFRELFSLVEFRVLFTASALSWIGDYVAKAAVTVLVYRQTDSVALSAAAFAASYLPWLVGGPLLSALAERYRYRQVMVACDLVRMALMVLVALPGMPPWAILALIFAATLANPPSQAARSALMPQILAGDRLVVGLSVSASTGQAAQVLGYLLGAAVAAVNPAAALLINAATFGFSAALVRFGLHDRPPAMTEAHRSHLLRETAEGFALVFGRPVLRAIAVLVFSAMLFSIVPEGLAAAWAAERAGDGMDTGTAQAVIMAANPVGYVLGGLVVGRLVAPARRLALMRPLAVIAPAVLVPALLDPPPIVVALLAAACGFAVAGLIPVANGLFVQVLPDGYRARAFGVMASGTQIIQGAAVLATGALAERFAIPSVVGAWSAAGVLLMVLAVLTWPRPATIEAAVEAARVESGATAAKGERCGHSPVRGSTAGDRPGERSRRRHAVT
ncbi:MFS-type transporter involved in bile tolerance, Atg22 family [Micromonospora chaiyaphumensis]|uniref:MFS-type transporter involved in bile tolerance, Atg22 family n=1 Tax=Micromonospora chaiyaphumensis TaxID=307119 RepID=A0A1C4ZF95_9ACTN|nr:MFS-type transporter involved in bile tolerance, Atg22 family [Micromonospora chaiyaphumensis]